MISYNNDYALRQYLLVTSPFKYGVEHQKLQNKVEYVRRRNEPLWWLSWHEPNVWRTNEQPCHECQCCKRCQQDYSWRRRNDDADGRQTDSSTWSDDSNEQCDEWRNAGREYMEPELYGLEPTEYLESQFSGEVLIIKPVYVIRFLLQQFFRKFEQLCGPTHYYKDVGTSNQRNQSPKTFLKSGEYYFFKNNILPIILTWQFISILKDPFQVCRIIGSLIDIFFDKSKTIDSHGQPFDKNSAFQGNLIANSRICFFEHHQRLRKFRRVPIKTRISGKTVLNIETDI